MPRLQRFYHAGDPLAWFNMPPVWLNAFIAMLPRLESEEMLSAIDVARFGGYTHDPDAASELIEELQKRVEGDAELNGEENYNNWAARMITMGFDVTDESND